MSRWHSEWLLPFRKALSVKHDICLIEKCDMQATRIPAMKNINFSAFYSHTHTLRWSVFSKADCGLERWSGALRSSFQVAWKAFRGCSSTLFRSFDGRCLFWWMILIRVVLGGFWWWMTPQKHPLLPLSFLTDSLGHHKALHRIQTGHRHLLHLLALRLTRFTTQLFDPATGQQDLLLCSSSFPCWRP